MHEEERFIDDKAAADLLGLSRSYLRQLRIRGDGPPFYRFSAKAVRYRVAELISWVNTRSAASTSDYA